nr:hypothetical protein [Candidatus Sigynarchaeum springense]
MQITFTRLLKDCHHPDMALIIISGVLNGGNGGNLISMKIDIPSKRTVS